MRYDFHGQTRHPILTGTAPNDNLSHENFGHVWSDKTEYPGMIAEMIIFEDDVTLNTSWSTNSFLNSSLVTGMKLNQKFSRYALHLKGKNKILTVYYKQGMVYIEKLHLITN